MKLKKLNWREFYKLVKILVTGGSGFIGSHLVERLYKEGHSVTIIDKKPSDNHFVSLIDISDGAEVDSFFEVSYEFEIIYHLAAKPWAKVTTEDEWIKESRETFNANTIGTYNLIKNCGETPFVFSSTANLYGDGKSFHEHSPANISSPYGYSKYVAERVIQGSMKRYTIFRFGTVVGTRGRTFPNRLVWCAVNHVPVEIFCDGVTCRDLIDVRDIVSALLIASKLPDDIFNISSGSEISGRDLAELVSSEARERGHELDYSYVSWKAPGYVPNSALDITKIGETGLWKPKIPLRQTIKDLFLYYEQDKNIKIPPKWNEL